MTTLFSSEASIIINSTVEKVWDALTVPEQVKEYFFNTNLVTDWKVNSPIYFRGEWDGKKYEDKGKVLDFVPNKSLSYSYWSNFSGLEDREDLYQIITYSIDKADAGVLVSIKQSNVETKEKAEHSNQNWKMVLESLKTYVEGK